MTGFRIGNIMLGTADLERSLKFYNTVLGLPVQFQSTEMAFLDAGAITLCLSTPHARLSTPVAGATEVVFVVESVRQAHADLSARGITFLNAPRNVTGDQWAANFRDPDGHLLSIFGPEDAPSVVPYGCSVESRFRHRSAATRALRRPSRKTRRGRIP